MPLLEVKDLMVRYDKAVLLNGVSLQVGEGEFVGLVGPNGAGKSTFLRAISGLVRFEERMKRGGDGEIVLEGEVRFAGERIDGLAAHEIRMRGLVHCPERRRPFRELTVEENLLAGAYLSRSAKETRRSLDRAYALFPKLAERKAQLAGKLSGGEQQMLAMARALAIDPKVLLLDELSMGLAPLIVEDLYEVVKRIAADDVSILVVEQFAHEVLGVADVAAIMLNGRVQSRGDPAEVGAALEAAYLGGTVK